MPLVPQPEPNLVEGICTVMAPGAVLGMIITTVRNGSPNPKTCTVIRPLVIGVLICIGSTAEQFFSKPGGMNVQVTVIRDMLMHVPPGPGVQEAGAGVGVGGVTEKLPLVVVPATPRSSV